ncbi:DUF5712 family protein [Aquimarina gracilis]|uniref:DUF5712 family protein n=1 Tax=Aquimarina gracilis TaxID=874422 RepID=A0ABU5ZQY1_9FLAO|nr:DUF5712 family protein [Aquimarina gracilis]MEB3344329.1 DUF5712 family protein [Aquimarina gracilis]
MPVSIVHKTSGDNKGSCTKYGFYLNKENQEYIKQNQHERQQFFFNQDNDKISTIKAIDMIDTNAKGKGLRKNVDRYFTLTINLSEKELKHIAKLVSGKEIRDVKDLNQEEYKKYNQAIRSYSRKCMMNYAKNFNKNITYKDISWFAKVEHQRRYKGYEDEVIKGKEKSGAIKPGLQTHVHITVSRMHKYQRINLSPRTNARKSDKLTLNGIKRSGGFDRSNWKQLNEDSFDKMFGYSRSLEEKFETHRILKNGCIEEQIAMKSLIEKENQRDNINQISY